MRPMAYIVASRVVGAWIALPFLYVIGLGIMYFAEWLVVVKQLGEVSNGGYLNLFWLFQNPTDFFYSLLKIMAMGTAIVFVGCYYGYKARGGPVGVGWNTAKSMMLNMVLVHVIGMFGTQLFWGLSPERPDRQLRRNPAEQKPRAKQGEAWPPSPSRLTTSTRRSTAPRCSTA